MFASKMTSKMFSGFQSVKHGDCWFSFFTVSIRRGLLESLTKDDVGDSKNVDVVSMFLN